MTVPKTGLSLKCNSVAQDELCHNKTVVFTSTQNKNKIENINIAHQIYTSTIEHTPS